ncbi:MAG: hypothetical protein AB1716_08820 [Planctomycetota bacterium]
MRTIQVNRGRRRATVVLFTCLAGLCPHALRADGFILDWYTFDGGGGAGTTGGAFALSGTIGQPDASVTPMTGGDFTLVGGFWSIPPVAPVCPGDCNCDGQVNFSDINPFVLALSDLPGWQARYPNCLLGNPDVNGDGRIDFSDINPFVALLSAGGGPCP